MDLIPLTRARHAGNFLIALKDQGLPVSPYLNRFNLSEGLIENIGSSELMSAITMMNFAEKAAKDQGVMDLGYYAGFVPVEEYGRFGKRVTSMPNLYTSLKTFCEEVDDECSLADYFLTHIGENAWFCHAKIDGPPVLQLQHELYVIRIMLQVIQLALGKEWSPRQIRIQSTCENYLLENEFLRNINIEFGARVTGVELPRRSFIATMQPSSKSEKPFDKTHLRLHPLKALPLLIEGFIRQDTIPSIEVSAEACGVSPRSLQRYLKEQNTSYRKLLDQVRMDISLPLLSDNGLSVAQISREVGYTDVANFTRAFKRINGLTPSEYRDYIQQK